MSVNGLPCIRSVLSKSPALDATESDWCTVRVMVQQGEYELHRGQFDKALAYMDKAVKVGKERPLLAINHDNKVMILIVRITKVL